MAEEEMTLQGQSVGSVNEWYVGQAIEYFKLNYSYQYPVNGGRQRGGQVIDFMIWKPPLPIPVYVQGDYWHSGARGVEDTLKQYTLEQDTKGQFDRPVLIWEHECETLEAAIAVVRERIGP